ncbi:hypothetical protein ACP4OV_021107 [Aristida adscensionis]
MACRWLVYAACLAAALALPTVAADDHPTQGFSPVRLNEGNFMLQWPYNVARSSRYSRDGDVRKLWVFSTDKPFKPDSPTKPRTEMRMTGYDYSFGVWQFEGRVLVPAGTTGVSIMQVFGGSPTATTLMLHVYDGSLWYYHDQVVESNIYDRWLRINVIHDVDNSSLTVFINGNRKLTVPGRGGTSHYFKFGVYEQKNPSNRMESHWKNVRILQKN